MATERQLRRASLAETGQSLPVRSLKERKSSVADRSGSQKPTLESGLFDAAYIENLRDGNVATRRHFLRLLRPILRMRFGPQLSPPESMADLLVKIFVRVVTALEKGEGPELPHQLVSFANLVCDNVLYESYQALANVDRHEKVEQKELRSAHEPAKSGTKKSNVMSAASLQSAQRRILRRATEVIGSEEAAMRWMGTPVRALDYATPISLLHDDKGFEAVRIVLGRLEHGIL